MHRKPRRSHRPIVTWGVLIVATLLALVACVSFTRDGRPIRTWDEPRPDERGRPFGSLWVTYYWLVEEADYSGVDHGDKDTTLFDKACRPIAKTTASFSDALCVEGSGRLTDGRVINYAATCACGRACPNGGKVCYSELSPDSFPWGMGSRLNPLTPLRSIATDPRILPHGTLVYIQDFDGATIPRHGDLGGFVHDGCFRADDVGTAIEGTHIDIFAGSEPMWQSLEAIAPTHDDITMFIDAPRCRAVFQGL